MNEANEGTGTITSKEEKMKKNGTEKFWKFTIRLDGQQNDTNMSMWEYEAGNDVSLGDRVKIYWSEKKSNYNGKDITYRNINSIALLDDADDVKETPSLNKVAEENVGGGDSGQKPTTPPNGAVVGMVSNQAMQYIISKNISYQENFSKIFDIIWKENEKKRKELGL